MGRLFPGNQTLVAAGPFALAPIKLAVSRLVESPQGLNPAFPLRRHQFVYLLVHRLEKLHGKTPAPFAVGSGVHSWGWHSGILAPGLNKAHALG